MEASLPVVTRLRSPRGLRFAAIAAGAVIVTSTAGRIISAPGVAGWYRTIAKPSFNPPNWAFPVAWSTLFVLMGIAFWRVLRLPVQTSGRCVATILFVTQLVVNVCWSLAFFGAHSPILGLAVIVPFLMTILATMRAFYKVDVTAALLLVPYVAWVSFATVLNAAIVRLN
jgi:tryptophan-rich sensory protein